MKSFAEIVHIALEREASDLHMTVGLPPIYLRSTGSTAIWSMRERNGFRTAISKTRCIS